MLPISVSIGYNIRYSDIGVQIGVDIGCDIGCTDIMIAAEIGASGLRMY